MTKQLYYATQRQNGTEDEITIYTPKGRPMLCVGFWDARDCDDGSKNAQQLKDDTSLIVKALNCMINHPPFAQASLRDWLAGQALNGFLANSASEIIADADKLKGKQAAKALDGLAEMMYLLADAMVKAREQ